MPVQHDGDDPQKTMLERNLRNAEAIIALCSKDSKSSGWLWWETSSVWTRNKFVMPLFVDVSANEFGAPLAALVQGKSLFDIRELEEAIQKLRSTLGRQSHAEGLTKAELAKLSEFRLHPRGNDVIVMCK
ncbi:MAG: TIR domain-containing protein [Nitrospiria bacterium]